ALREGRLIEHDRVEAYPEALEPAELVEHVTDARVDGHSVSLRVQTKPCDRVLRDIEGDRLLAGPGELERKPAVVAEAVEQAATSVPLRGFPVLALIEEQAGLLTTPEVGVVPDAAFHHGNGLGHVSGHDVDPLLESFKQ